MKRKSFPLRVHPDILEAMQTWANDDLRSINAQIEFILRDSLARAGRLDQSLYNISAQEKERED